MLRIKGLAGGLSILCPESSSSDDYFGLVVPPITIANDFSQGAESCRVGAAVRLSSHIKGVQADLLSFDLDVSVCRQLSLQHSSKVI